jgi:hypothetical protein
MTAALAASRPAALKVSGPTAFRVGRTQRSVTFTLRYGCPSFCWPHLSPGNFSHYQLAAAENESRLVAASPAATTSAPPPIAARNAAKFQRTRRRRFETPPVQRARCDIAAAMPGDGGALGAEHLLQGGNHLLVTVQCSRPLLVRHRDDRFRRRISFVPQLSLGRSTQEATQRITVAFCRRALPGWSWRRTIIYPTLLQIARLCVE